MSILRQSFRKIGSFGSAHEAPSTTATVLSEEEHKLEYDGQWSFAVPFVLNSETLFEWSFQNGER